MLKGAGSGWKPEVEILERVVTKALVEALKLQIFTQRDLLERGQVLERDQ